MRREHFAVHCESPRCRFASVLHRSISVAQDVARRHVEGAGHVAVVRHTTERTIASYGEPCECRLPEAEAVK